MRKLAVFSLIGLVLEAPPALAKDIQFWNLTQDKIVALQLSPAGNDIWGKNQTDNDPDHAVDPDERLKITDTISGTYDVRFRDEKGRTCVVKNLIISAGQIFSIEESKLKDCK